MLFIINLFKNLCSPLKLSSIFKLAEQLKQEYYNKEDSMESQNCIARFIYYLFIILI